MPPLLILLLLLLLLPTSRSEAEEAPKPWRIEDVVFNASKLGNTIPILEPASLFGILVSQFQI